MTGYVTIPSDDQPPPRPGGPVARALAALHWMGWSEREIARLLGFGEPRRSGGIIEAPTPPPAARQEATGACPVQKLVDAMRATGRTDREIAADFLRALSPGRPDGA